VYFGTVFNHLMLCKNGMCDISFVSYSYVLFFNLVSHFLSIVAFSQDFIGTEWPLMS